jgi:hypothetical protein
MFGSQQVLNLYKTVEAPVFFSSAGCIIKIAVSVIYQKAYTADGSIIQRLIFIDLLFNQGIYACIP